MHNETVLKIEFIVMDDDPESMRRPDDVDFRSRANAFVAAMHVLGDEYGVGFCGTTTFTETETGRTPVPAHEPINYGGIANSIIERLSRKGRTRRS